MDTGRYGAVGTTESTQFQLVCRDGCQHPPHDTAAGGAGAAVAGAVVTTANATVATRDAAAMATEKRRRVINDLH